MSFDYTNKAWMRQRRNSLKNTSYDAENNEYMTESDLNVLSFDDIKEDYLKEHNLRADMANSVDALSTDGDLTYLIEFKNGKETDHHQIENKLKDSVSILCDEWGRTLSDTRKDIVFVLVYNEDQKHFPEIDRRAIAMANKSGNPHKHFGLNKANMYVKKAVIFSKTELETKLLKRLKAI